MGLFNFVTGVLTGLYAGIYLTQNYNVPAVPDPTSIVEKAKKFLEENKKDSKDWLVSNIITTV